jgi:hypothetical protein
MKLTPEQKQAVTNALVVLAPAQATRDQCRSDIEDALENVDWEGVEPKPYSKKTKLVVAALVASLMKARNLHIKLEPLDDYGIMSPLDLRHLNEQIAFYEEWLAERPDGPHRKSAKQKAAVKEARALVMKYCKKKKEYFGRRKNKWWKLSAILFGDPQPDLFRHMRAFKNRPDPV